ncbi:unnamed protein product [Phytophthora fragariaefolia]|uniref:Unnamed protein product n=1 Tax=Phytophthora fragariaefolia TaxID=1490495 RepID=A0A9W6X0I8_9STRA|nr:unnamed protein product [Phytophthora fragariaefolia]
MARAKKPPPSTEKPPTKNPPRTNKPPPAKKKPRLSERERGNIEGLHLAGASGRDIARVTTRSQDTVHHVISPALSKTPRRHGLAPLLSDRDTRRLVRTAAKGQLAAAKLKVELVLSVSVRTIQRTLQRVDWLVYTKMENTLPLKPEDMLARKAWASSMLLRKDAVPRLGLHHLLG